MSVIYYCNNTLCVDGYVQQFLTKKRKIPATIKGNERKLLKINLMEQLLISGSYIISTIMNFCVINFIFNYKKKTILS